MRDVFKGMNSKVLNKYVIHFKGLKIGKHIFNFDVNDDFFNEFESCKISRGELNVDVIFHKHSTMLEMDFSIEGKVEVPCDRCLELFYIPISYEGKVIVKISSSIEEDLDDSVWYVDTNEHEINIAHYIYESINLSVPIQHYHGMLGTSIDDCDKEMLKKLNEMRVENDDKINLSKVDSRWEKLKNLSNN